MIARWTFPSEKRGDGETMARINFKEPARGPNDCPLQHTYNDRLGTNIHKEDGHLFAAVCFCPASRPQSIELSNEENYLKR